MCAQIFGAVPDGIEGEITRNAGDMMMYRYYMNEVLPVYHWMLYNMRDLVNSPCAATGSVEERESRMRRVLTDGLDDMGNCCTMLREIFVSHEDVLWDIEGKISWQMIVMTAIEDLLYGEHRSVVKPSAI